MMKDKPMLRFLLRENLPGYLLFVAANIGIIVILLIIAQFMTGDVSVSYTSIGLSTGIYMLVIASVGLRSSLRLGAQMGVSRNRCFLDFLLFSILSALVLSAAIEVVLSVFSAVTAATGMFHFSDLFAMLYLGELDAGALSLSQHLLSTGFNLCAILFCTAIGAILSMLFWRLNRLGRTIIVILLIAAPFWFSLLLVNSLSTHLPAFFFFAGQPRNVIAVLLLAAALLFFLSWLLSRTVHIRPGK